MLVECDRPLVEIDQLADHMVGTIRPIIEALGAIHPCRDIVLEPGNHQAASPKYERTASAMIVSGLLPDLSASARTAAASEPCSVTSKGTGFSLSAILAVTSP